MPPYFQMSMISIMNINLELQEQDKLCLLSSKMGNCFPSRVNRMKIQVDYSQDINSFDEFIEPKLYIHLPSLAQLNSEEKESVIGYIASNLQIKRIVRLQEEERIDQTRLIATFDERQNTRRHRIEDDQLNFLFVYWPNPELQIPAYKNFQKIGFAFLGKKPEGMEEQLKKQYGYRFRGLFPLSPDGIQSFFSSACRPRALYVCNSDVGLINRIWLAINFFQGKEYDNSHLAFEKIFNFYRQKMRSDYALPGKSQQKKVAEQLVMGNPILVELNNVVKKTLNPSVLLHLSRFYNDLQGYISNSYRQVKDDIKQMMQVFVVAELSEDEQKSLDRGKNFMFSSFVAGYLDQKEAEMEKSKNQRNFLFKIKIPPQIKNYNAKIDHGFCLIGNRVLFALCTFFKTKSFSRPKKEAEIIYGILGRLINLRRQDFRYLNIPSITSEDILLLKLFDIVKLSEMNLYRIQYPNRPYQVGNERGNEEQVWVLSRLYLHLEMLQKYQSFKRGVYYHSQIYQSISTAANSSQNSIRLTKKGYEKIEAEAQYLHYSQSQNEQDLILQLCQMDILGKEVSVRSFEEIRQIIQNNRLPPGYKGIILLNYYSLQLLRVNEDRTALDTIKKTIEQLSKEFMQKYGLTNEQNQREDHNLQWKHEYFHPQSLYCFPLCLLMTRTSSLIHKKDPSSLRSANAYQQDFQNGLALFDGIYINWIPKDL